VHLQADSQTDCERRGGDVIAAPAAAAPLQRADAFATLSHLVAPPDALLLQLLSDPAAPSESTAEATGGRSRNHAQGSRGFGHTLQHEALAAASTIFGAAGVDTKQPHAAVCSRP